MHDYADDFLRFGTVFDVHLRQELFVEYHLFLCSRVDYFVIFQILPKALDLDSDGQVSPRIRANIGHLTEMKRFDFFGVFSNQERFLGGSTSTVFIVRVHDGVIQLILQNIGRHLRFLHRGVVAFPFENVSLSVLYYLLYSAVHANRLL